MFKSTLVRYTTAAIVSTTIALGTFGFVKGEGIYTPHYLVFNRTALADGFNCTTSFNDKISTSLAKYTNDVADGVCVIKVDLSVDGIEQMPEELAEQGLQGIYPATDESGQPIPFTVYLPMINPNQSTAESTPQK